MASLEARKDLNKTLYAKTLIEDTAQAALRLVKKDENVLTGLFKFVKVAMTHVEKITDLSGVEKKELVIDVVHRIIEIDDGPLDMFDEILKPMVRGAVEEFVDIDKNGFKLKTKKCKGLFPCCK